MLETKGVYRVLLPVYLALTIFILGNGFLVTLIVIRLNDFGASVYSIGLTTSFYYVGMVLGSNKKMSSYILSLGHVRAYCAITAISIMCVLAFGFTNNEHIWKLLMLAAGFCFGGYYLVVESWIMCLSNKSNSGKLISIYIIAFAFARALSQFFLRYQSDNHVHLFSIMAMFLCASILPIMLAHSKSPKIEAPELITLNHIFQVPKLGIYSGFISGMTLGGINGLLPIFVKHSKFGNHEVSIVMFSLLIGGAILQMPVGYLIDRLSPSKILLGISSLLLAMFLILSFYSIGLMYFVIFVFFIGAAAGALYPTGLSMACRNVSQGKIVSTNQIISMSYGVGAIIGPAIAPLFTDIFGKHGLFVYLSVVSATLSVLCIIYYKTPLKAKG